MQKIGKKKADGMSCEDKVDEGTITMRGIIEETERKELLKGSWYVPKKREKG